VPATEADVIKQQTPDLFDGYAQPDRILVRLEVWRRYCDGFDPAEINKHFKQCGTLIPGKDSMSRTEQVIGKIDRFYVVSRAALTA
jgi:hypothetical protein